ncbi:MAG: AI-2E family transporter, partial [Chloroflexota bacterium]|nr:AI-2E family transporter [Chloroflexota bacterium]
ILHNGRRDDEPDTPRMRTVRFEIAPRSILLILAIIAGILLIARLWEIVLILIIALVLAGTFSPVVSWLEGHRVPRPLALSLLLVALLGFIVGLGALIIPAFVHQFGTLSTDAPRIQAKLADFAARVPPLAGQADAIRAAKPDRLLTPIGVYALKSAGAAAQLVVLGGTTIVIAFYLIADHERVQGFLFALLPRHYHIRTARVLLDMETVVGGYMRGQAITSLCIGVFAFLLLQVTGVPAALPLAILAAFADLIPLVGGVLAVAPSVLFALTVGPLQAAIVLVSLVIYQQFESHLLLPRVYGQSLRLSPLAVIIALLVGGTLLGIVGALLALPMAAGIRVLIENYRIELPGEHPGEKEERAEEDRAEATYAAETQGTSAMESAMLATQIAGQLQEAEAEETGKAEVPVEERSDPPHRPPPVRTPSP